jgi:hypothetical protein
MTHPDIERLLKKTSDLNRLEVNFDGKKGVPPSIKSIEQTNIFLKKLNENIEGSLTVNNRLEANACNDTTIEIVMERFARFKNGRTKIYHLTISIKKNGDRFSWHSDIRSNDDGEMDIEYKSGKQGSGRTDHEEDVQILSALIQDRFCRKT